LLIVTLVANSIEHKVQVWRRLVLVRAVEAVAVVDLDEAVIVTLVQDNQSKVLRALQFAPANNLQRTSEASRSIMGCEHR
jgi:hypothetical protein